MPFCLTVAPFKLYPLLLFLGCLPAARQSARRFLVEMTTVCFPPCTSIQNGFLEPYFRLLGLYRGNIEIKDSFTEPLGKGPQITSNEIEDEPKLVTHSVKASARDLRHT